MAAQWHRVDDDEFRTRDGSRSVVVDGRTRRAGPVRRHGSGALENHCPHQGGPLGEGSIEKGWLRCPWHGYDYDPITGQPPEGFADAVPAYPVEERADGVYVELPDVTPPAAHGRPTCWSRRWSRSASRTSSAWSGTPTSASPTRCAGPRSAARSPTSASGTRARRRSRRAPTASSPAGRRRASRSPGRARPTCSPACTTQARRRAGRRDLRPGAVEGAAAAARSRTSTCRAVFADVAVSTPRSCRPAATTPSWPRWR